MCKLSIDVTSVLENEGFVTPVTTLHLITHPGVFHADDVCSAALIKYLFTAVLQNTFDGDICPEFIVHRVVEADIPKLQQTILEAGEDYIVFDIGHGCFDHHQDDSPCREGTDDAPGIPYASFEGSFQLQQAVSDGNVIEISVTCGYYTLSTNTYGQIFQFPISIETITPHAAYTDNAILRSGDREVPSIVVNVKNDSSNQTSVSRIFSLNFRFKIKNYLSSGNYKFRVDLFNHNTTGGMIRVHTVTTSTRLVTITHSLIDRDEE